MAMAALVCQGWYGLMLKMTKLKICSPVNNIWIVPVYWIVMFATQIYCTSHFLGHVALLEESVSTSTSVRIDTSFFWLSPYRTIHLYLIIFVLVATRHVIPSDALLYIHSTEIIRNYNFPQWFWSTAVWLDRLMPSNSWMMVENLPFSMRRTVPAGHEYLLFLIELQRTAGQQSIGSQTMTNGELAQLHLQDLPGVGEIIIWIEIKIIMDVFACICDELLWLCFYPTFSDAQIRSERLVIHIPIVPTFKHTHTQDNHGGLDLIISRPKPYNLFGDGQISQIPNFQTHPTCFNIRLLDITWY